MHAPWLTIHELAKALKVRIKTVRRAYLRGEIPLERIFRFVRFELDRIKEATRRKGQEDVDQLNQSIQRNGHGWQGVVDTAEGATCRAPGGASRRCDGQRRPRLVETGAQTTHLLTEVLSIL